MVVGTRRGAPTALTLRAVQYASNSSSVSWGWASNHRNKASGLARQPIAPLRLGAAEHRAPPDSANTRSPPAPRCCRPSHAPTPSRGRRLSHRGRTPSPPSVHQRHRATPLFCTRAAGSPRPVRGEIAHELLAELRTRDRRQVARSRFILPVLHFRPPTAAALRSLGRTRPRSITTSPRLSSRTNAPAIASPFRRPVPAAPRWPLRAFARPCRALRTTAVR